MTKQLKVLLLEDSLDDAELAVRELHRAGHVVECERVDARAPFLAALEARAWDVVLTDDRLPTYDATSALTDAREAGHEIPFILLTGAIGEANAVAIMKAGAQDYVPKGDLSRLPAVVVREVRHARGRAEQERMRARLVITERMASAGALAAGVAHQINNPLAIAFGCVDFVVEVTASLEQEASALSEPDRARLAPHLAELAEPLRDARVALRRIRDIVRDVRLFVRPQEDQRGTLDVRSVIESALLTSWNEVGHRARVTRKLDEVPLVDANEARLGQVMVHLLVNAAQAMPEGRADGNEIHVVTRSAQGGRSVVIEVRDTGAGIRSENVGRIFDPFFTTKASGVGTGLGLSICQRIVSELGGAIDVDSRLGEGTTFRITLPSAAPPADGAEP